MSGTNKPSKNDYLHSTLKGAISTIPILGGVLSEFFGLTIISPLQKRQEAWLNSLHEDINILKRDKQNDYYPDNLKNNENFISIVAQSSQIVNKNHLKEKLEYLKNASINSVTSKIEFEDQTLFINYIETFTLLHITILNRFEERGYSGIDSKTDQVDGVIIYNLHVTHIWKVKIIIQELINNGLLEKKYSNYSNTQSLKLNIYISDFGKSFLGYIRK